MTESLRRRAGRFGLDVIMINVWEGPEASKEAARYCQMWGIEATVLLDETAAYARAVGVRGVPTNVFVDAAGVVSQVGSSTAHEMLREAQRLAPGLPGEGSDPERVDRFSWAFAHNRQAPSG